MRIYRIFAIVRLYVKVFLESLLPVFKNFKQKLRAEQRLVEYEKHIRDFPVFGRLSLPNPIVEKIRTQAVENYNGPIKFTASELAELEAEAEAMKPRKYFDPALYIEKDGVFYPKDAK